MAEDFNKLNAVIDKAKKAGVSVNMHYVECTDSYWFEIDSIAPAERWIGRDRSFNYGIERVTEALDKLLGLNKLISTRGY